MKKRETYSGIVRKQEQQDLFFADTRYVMLLSALITSGKASEIGPIAFAAFVCLRTHANYVTGLVSIGQRLIGKQIGASTGSVAKAIATLQEHGLIKVDDKRRGKGGRPVYQLVEKIPVYQDEKPAGEMTFPFQPLALPDRLNEAREIIHSGEVPARSPINLHLTINIVQHTGVGDIIINTPETSGTYSLENMPKSVQDFFSRMIKSEN